MIKEKSILKFSTGVLIGVIVAGLFFFIFFKEDSSNEKPLTQEDCSKLAELAETKKADCIIKTMGESSIYGYGYEPYLENGSSCFYNVSTGMCYPAYKRDWRNFLYPLEYKLFFLAYEDAEESCSKSFPEKKDVFVECLANISNP